MKETQGVLEFVRVIETGSFSAAAHALEMSKAYVSQRVSQLEDRLGVRLLQRTTRKLSLTEAGRIYYRYAREVAVQLQEAEDRVRDFCETPKGQLRVTLVDGGLGEWYLAPALARFAAQNREVSLELDMSSRLVDIVAEGFDFAIRVGPLPDSSLLARKLTTFRYGLYASPFYLKQHGIITRPEQLAGHNCLSGAAQRWQLTRGTETFTCKPQGSWHSKSGQALIYAAEVGLGIVRTASFYAERALLKGRIIEILPDWSQTLTPVWIVYPSGRNQPRRVTAAINFLLDEFSGGPPWQGPRGTAQQTGS